MPYNAESAEQETLIERVEYRADQVTATGQTQPINRESVYGEMEEAARTILRKSPREYVYPAAKDGASTLNGNAVLTNPRVLTLPLPADYIRFIRLQLAAWEIAVDDLLSVASTQYRLQANRYAAADAAHPICALVPHFTSEANQAIEAYPPESGTDPVQLFAYVGTTAPENMPGELMDAVLWETTGRVLQITRQDGAASAFEAAQRAIDNLRFGLKGEEVPVE